VLVTSYSAVFLIVDFHTGHSLAVTTTCLLISFWGQNLEGATWPLWMWISDTVIAPMLASMCVITISKNTTEIPRPDLTEL